ncbi:MAG: hypothetical protein AAB943_00660 [Patescibacteria group bacterium]
MKKFTKQLAIVFLGLGLATPLYAVEIINNVSSSASTGGNSAGSGEVIQGESKAQVKIYTEIDGEIVTDIDETVVAPNGEDAIIEKNIKKNIEPKKRNFLVAFLSKIFKYVFSIF